MSKPIPFKRLLEEYEDGQNVLCVTGTLIKLFDEKKGENTQGPWSLQNGSIKDSEGTIMKITFSKCAQSKNLLNKVITIESSKSQHGWNGIALKEESYTKDGKEIKNRVIWVTPSANFTFEGGDKPDQPKDQQSVAKTGNNPTHPALAMNDLFQMHQDCYNHAKDMLDAPEFDSDAASALTAQVFIQACKDGIQYGYVERRKQPLPKSYPKPPSPDKWQSCVIPSGSNEGKTLEDIADDDLRKLHAFYTEKGSDSPLAQCVYQAAKDRGVLPPDESDPWLPEEDELP